MDMTEKQKKTLLILDGQGGGVGRKIAERLLPERLAIEYLVVGSNAVATSNMMRAGVPAGATGENAWIFNCGKADIIVGPIGIVLANAMHGEISPAMALAVANSLAERVLVPIPNHHMRIAGLPDMPLAHYLDEMAKAVSLLAGL